LEIVCPELYKLIARFNLHAVQQIASQVSQINILLERHHEQTHAAIEGISRDMGLLRQEAVEQTRRARHTSFLLEEIAASTSLSNSLNKKTHGLKSVHFETTLTPLKSGSKSLQTQKMITPISNIVR
jgi:hypothetical protein